MTKTSEDGIPLEHVAAAVLVLANVAVSRPDLFDLATPRGDVHAEADFIREVAWRLHQTVSSRFGLVGMRGGTDAAPDGLAYKSDTGIRIIDCVAIDRRRLQWIDVTPKSSHEDRSIRTELRPGLPRWLEPKRPHWIHLGDEEEW